LIAAGALGVLGKNVFQACQAKVVVTRSEDFWSVELQIVGLFAERTLENVFCGESLEEESWI